MATTTTSLTTGSTTTSSNASTASGYTSAQWAALVQQYAANPSDVQAIQLARIKAIYGSGADIADPTFPFVQLLEANAITTAGAMMANSAMNNRQYAIMAQTREDLYYHMSDVDYIDRFATPSIATMQFWFSLDELYAKLVDTGTNSIAEIIIPRYTQVTVNGYTFTMQYPIIMRRRGEGGIQVIYDTTETSPIQTLTSNQVDWVIRTTKVNGQPTQFIILSVPMYQMEITSTQLNVNFSTGVKQTIPYDDQFYYVRAWSQASDGTLTEINTTHTPAVFDSSSPTVIVQDLGGSLAVSIPMIYLKNRSIGSEVILDVYTTKGDVSINLSSYYPQNFIAEWNGASSADSVYSAPLQSFVQMLIRSEDTTSDGINQIDFATLRARVLQNNLGPINLPILPGQLSAAATLLGYDSSVYVDQPTDRVITMTRALPVPTNGETINGAAMSIQTLITTFGALTNISTVANNGERVTILPTSLFRFDSGILSIVGDAERTALLAQDTESLVRTINAGTYLYTPFHYVLDASGVTFACRPYYLDNPQVTALEFVAENEQVAIDVGTAQDGRSLVRTATGWELRIKASSSASWKALPDDDCFCQLAFIPDGETAYAYLNGTLLTTDTDGERVYVFEINTDYDIYPGASTGNEIIDLTSFSMYTDGPRDHGALMAQQFDIFWAATGISGSAGTSSIDTDLGKDILPSGVLGISRERISITLGQALDELWQRARAILGSGTNETYATDVPAVWTSNNYKRDTVTGEPVIETIDGTPQFVILNKIGDPVLDADGNQVYLHKAGDAMYDAAGNVIPLEPGTMSRWVDLLMVEGVYWFATEQESKDYASSIPTTLAGWITGDIANLQTKALENTHVYFMPQSNLGNVDVVTRDNATLSIAAAQSFTVTYYLTKAAFDDLSSRTPLQDVTTTVLSNALTQRTVSTSSIISALQAGVSDDVLGIELSGLGGDNNLSTVTMSDNATRLAIKKVAIMEADGTIGVTNGVTINYLLHSVASSS